MEKPLLKVLFIVGTRPEAIKLAPLIQAFVRDDTLEIIVCLSGQHKDLAREALFLFNLTPQYDFRSDTKDQSLARKGAGLLQSLEGIIQKVRPDWIFVQGDTLTTFMGALAGFYAGIPVAHVEAGLRTHDPCNPFPEEAHRKMTAALASLHFAPTLLARENLLQENVPEGIIFVTGNTGIDALLQVQQSFSNSDEAFARQFENLADHSLKRNKRIVVATIHRSENRTDKLSNVLKALCTIARREDAQVILPVHPHPLVRQAITRIKKEKSRLLVIPPLPFPLFAWLLTQSFLIITDSGGIQEEATVLGVPVILVRDSTERAEALASKNIRLVQADNKAILAFVDVLWKDKALYRQMATPQLLFGDGKASQRILAFFKDHAGLVDGSLGS